MVKRARGKKAKSATRRSHKAIARRAEGLTTEVPRTGRCHRLEQTAKTPEGLTWRRMMNGKKRENEGQHWERKDRGGTRDSEYEKRGPQDASAWCAPPATSSSGAPPTARSPRSPLSASPMSAPPIRASSPRWARAAARETHMKCST
jgi:hypothetical protein